MKTIKSRAEVNAAIEISQINAKLSALRAEMSELEKKRDRLVYKLARKFSVFQFRDSLNRLFQITLSPRKREILDREGVEAICEEAGYELPLKTSRWVEARVYEVVEE